MSANVLDFDAVEPVKVILGGRSFELRPQSAKVVQTVLEYSSVDTARKIEGEYADGSADPDASPSTGVDPRRFVRGVFANWDDTVAAVALMVGSVPGSEGYAADVEFLTEHLSPTRAMQVFERWWEVNELDAFFAVGGRALMDRTTVALVTEIRKARTAAAVEAVAMDVEAVTPPSNAN